MPSFVWPAGCDGGRPRVGFCKAEAPVGHMRSVAKVTPGGTVERFERLFIDHLDAVLAYALARADPETAKDAVAETFLIAWRRLGEVPEPPRAWLLGVTRRTLAGQRRSRRRQHRLVQRILDMEVGFDTTREFEETVTDRFVVAAALGRLRAGDREMLCLVAWDGLDHHELAETFRCSPAAADVRLHRARRRLRAALASEDELQGARLRSVRQPISGRDAAEIQVREATHDDT
jgi:RNA polymerase sigma factor (sigma-70 family)